jgi:hypothetical protein
MRAFPLFLSPLLLLLADGLSAQIPSADDAALIRNALSAAPTSVADGATVVAGSTVLRQGTNGWVCVPDNPETANNSPICMDEQWREMMDALKNQRAPRITQVGISYMLQAGPPVSNIDPFATGPTEDNQWITEGMPHLMILIPDHSKLEGISTDPHNGGPWVLWKDTPYATLIIPAMPPTEQ